MLERLLVVPEIELARCATGQSPFVRVCANAMKVLLITGRVYINAGGLGELPICQAVERDQLEVVRLLAQAHDNALYMAARGGKSEMARVPLHLDQIDSNLEDCALVLAAQGTHLQVVDALLADRRLSLCSSTGALDFASCDSVRGVIQSKIDDFGTQHVSRPAQSFQQRISAFFIIASFSEGWIGVSVDHKHVDL
ncbi:hypothetical protein N7526_001868 [Penicillium atrosanguineum]|nr:hypothetical protein N7526_001868 [Penicillium atrosanguineum]